VVSPEDVKTALAVLRDNGEDAYVIGEIVRSDEGVELC
jgi:phosphoribosylformylglycinamidine cyclo-ligase